MWTNDNPQEADGPEPEVESTGAGLAAVVELDPNVINLFPPLPFTIDGPLGFGRSECQICLGQFMHMENLIAKSRAVGLQMSRATRKRRVTRLGSGMPLAPTKSIKFGSWDIALDHAEWVGPRFIPLCLVHLASNGWAARIGKPKVQPGDGSNTLLWLDNWHPLGSLHLTNGARINYSLSRAKFTKVDSMVRQGRRKWPRARSTTISNIIANTPNDFLPNEHIADTVIWTSNENGQYSTNSAGDKLGKLYLPILSGKLVSFSQQVQRVGIPKPSSIIGAISFYYFGFAFAFNLPSNSFISHHLYALKFIPSLLVD
ncbi:hypothetical protein RHMOL_Rhmol05G0108800 [Rhododendron molle]|uniref:Uncharacterized protein n=1 Tax=Rhododendron molle TaxID=49168 RepID=A0ACC0NNV8_RHOML|nr:hypothetical protein RHMOL_Rhmol05G0108800 [Rhododendron molle]